MLPAHPPLRRLLIALPPVHQPWAPRSGVEIADGQARLWPTWCARIWRLFEVTCPHILYGSWMSGEERGGSQHQGRWWSTRDSLWASVREGVAAGWGAPLGPQRQQGASQSRVHCRPAPPHSGCFPVGTLTGRVPNCTGAFAAMAEA